MKPKFEFEPIGELYGTKIYMDNDFNLSLEPPLSKGEEEFYAGASYRNLNATGKTQSQPAAFTEAERAAYEMGRQDGFGVCLELWERTNNFTTKERAEFIKKLSKYKADQEKGKNNAS